MSEKGVSCWNLLSIFRKQPWMMEGWRVMELWAGLQTRKQMRPTFKAVCNGRLVFHLCLCPPLSMVAIKPKFADFYGELYQKHSKEWNSTETFQSLWGSSPTVVVWRMLDGKGPFLPVHALCVCTCVCVCVCRRVCACALRLWYLHKRGPIACNREGKQFCCEKSLTRTPEINWKPKEVKSNLM